MTVDAFSGVERQTELMLRISDKRRFSEGMSAAFVLTDLDV
jgi:hypothetical protein